MNTTGFPVNTRFESIVNSSRVCFLSKLSQTPPARLLAPVLPPLLPPSLTLLCSREKMLKRCPASKKAPPAVSVTGKARSQAWHNCTKKALPIFLSQMLKSTSTEWNKFWRSGAYPNLKKKKILCAQPLPSSNSNKPETHRLTCIMR